MELGLLKLLLRNWFSLSAERIATTWKYLYPGGKRGAGMCACPCVGLLCAWEERNCVGLS